MKQTKIFISTLEPYKITNADTGEVIEGISVHYLEKVEPSEKRYGYARRKCSCPKEYRTILEKYTTLREVIADMEEVEQYDGSFKRRIVKINNEKVR